MMQSTKWLIGIPVMVANGFVAMMVNYPKTALISWLILIPMFIFLYFSDKKSEDKILDYALQILTQRQIISAETIANSLPGDYNEDKVFKILQAHKRNSKLPYNAEIKLYS